MSNVEINKCGKGTTLERCIRSAVPRLRICAGYGIVERTVRLVSAPVPSLRARSPSNQTPGTDSGARRTDHHQSPRRDCCAIARTCTGHGLHYRRLCFSGGFGNAGRGESAWLSAKPVPRSALNIALIGYLPPSWNRLMTFWCLIAPVVPADIVK